MRILPRTARGWLLTACALVSVGGSTWFLLTRDFEQEGPGRPISEPELEPASSEPSDPADLIQRGRTAAERGKFDEAIASWNRVPEDAGKEVVAEAHFLAAELLLHQRHQASAAEARLRQALEHDPHHRRALMQLARLLLIEGRWWESRPYILRSFQLEEVQVDLLALLDMPMGTLEELDVLKQCHLADRTDPAILAGLAASPAFQLEPRQTQILLEAALAANPQLLDAQARLGTLLLESGALEEFLKWHTDLPASADQHPEIWAVRAHWAQQNGELRVAARCYWETLRRHPSHRKAAYQLGQLLVKDGRPADAEPLIEQGQQQQKLQQLQDVLLNTEHTDLEPMRRVAYMLEQLGRIWEAWGWSQVALQLNPQEVWARQTAKRLKPKLRDLDQASLPESSPIAHLDLRDYPLPETSSGSLADRTPPADSKTRIRFTDRTDQIGLDFTYFNSGRPASEGRRMYEFPGGGVGSLDYDLDGWPDLILTQGCRWPPRPMQEDFLDRLFRNAHGERFIDVTDRARLRENSYSHGMAVGDFNVDGFPDLLIANIGQNRLFENNGDGTFTERTSAISGDAQRWTTSCLVADLNHDSLPDIYAVNYLEAEDVFERVCKHGDGAPRMCMPFHFPGSQDQLFLNLGNGRFEEATATAGIEVADGKGLGIIAADIDNSPGLDLFIANDATPNSFFVNRTEPSEFAPSAAQVSFQEQALSAGLAYNADGRAEACMGIAAGDADQDGALDFFIGNFYKETNTLYLQQQSGLFVDRTVSSGLARPSQDLLAFGTQFLDADLDGDLDLIVTNGHVHDARAYGRPYHMRPQCFENRGAAKFVERRAAEIGPFFDKEFLGRGLARLDWNRDGLEDVVISHLDSPAVLLENESRPPGSWLALRLVGVAASRDAIGTLVTVHAGEGTMVRQLTAGDGYQSSNQRQLVFGLPRDPKTVDRIDVRWPGGQTTSFTDVPVAQEYVAVEGLSQLISLPGS